MNLRVSLAFCCLLIVASPVFAMSSASELPPVEDCGFPADGHVAHEITYTLTSDCPTDGDVHVTHGVTVTIDSNGFCFKIRIEDGQVIVIGKDGASTTYTSGTISACSSGSSGQQTWTLPQGCFQRLGAIGIICRVPGPGPTIEVWEITPDSVGHLLLRVSQPKVDAARPDGLVASTPDGRVAVRVRPDEHITVSMGPGPEGKVHHVSLEFTLNGRVIGTVDTYGGPPGAPVSALPAVPAAPAAPAAPAISSGPRVSPIISRHPAQEDGSLIHVVRPGQTLFSIARAYGVPMQDLIRRNRLEPGGAWLLSGQVLVIRDAPTPDDAGDADYADDADAATLDECDSIIHVVQAGETIYSIAQAYDVHPRHLAIRNQIPYGGNRLHSGQQLVIPDVTSAQGDCGVAALTRHVVQPGHTLYSIALVYGVALDDLIRLNRLTNEGHTLYCGQVLTIRYLAS